MPEVTIYEDRNLLSCKYDVRRARQRFDVLSKPQTQTAESPLDFSFERAIT